MYIALLICGTGEDWRAIGQLAGVDISTLHAYERHMERQTALPVGGMSGALGEDVGGEACAGRVMP